MRTADILERIDRLVTGHERQHSSEAAGTVSSDAETRFVRFLRGEICNLEGHVHERGGPVCAFCGQRPWCPDCGIDYMRASPRACVWHRIGGRSGGVPSPEQDPLGQRVRTPRDYRNPV